MDNENVYIVGIMNPSQEGVGRALKATYEVGDTALFAELLALLDELTADDDQP